MINVIIISHSFKEIGPISLNCFAAIEGASFVSFISGGYDLYKNKGIKIKHNSPGTDAAIAQLPHVMVTPMSAANF
ncbi:hypothetical protein D3C80_1224030 [compost metagenome]